MIKVFKSHYKLISLLSFFSFLPIVALAHVGYVLSEEVIIEKAGSDWNYLRGVFSSPLNLIIMAVSVIILVLAVYAYIKNKHLHRWLLGIGKKASSYEDLIPWILRLSLGIALVGAGISEVLISPSLSAEYAVSSLEVVLGFLFLSGLFIAPACVITISLYIYALTIDTYIFGNLDFVTIAFVILILGDARPGVDDLFGIPFCVKFDKLRKYVSVILRSGVGIAMIYLSLFEKFLNPHLAAEVVSLYNLQQVVPVSAQMWVFSTGFIELLVGLLLVIGFQTRVISTLAVLFLTLSFFYFGEDVYSHVTLFGILSVIFVTGGGALSLDKKFKHIHSLKGNII